MSSDDKYVLILIGIICGSIVAIVSMGCWCSVARAKIFAEHGYNEIPGTGNANTYWVKP